MKTLLIELTDSFNNRIFAVKPPRSHYPYRKFRELLANFLSERYGRQDVALSDIAAGFEADFHRYLLQTGLSERSVAVNERILRQVMQSADNQVATIVVRNHTVATTCLTKNELLKFSETPMPSERLERVRDIFLFACFTSLRHDDIREMTAANLSDDGSWLMFVRRMTKVLHRIPLLDIPRRIIDKYRNPERFTLLPVITPEKTNLYLREVIAHCGIDKRLTFASARHTFAGTVACANGISLETIAYVMGNSDSSISADDTMAAEFAKLADQLTDFNHAYTF